jgi:hypothetical protein
MSATAKHKGKTVVPHPTKILGVPLKISHTKQYRCSAAEARRKHRRSIQFYVHNVRKTDGYRLKSRRSQDRNLPPV